MKWYKEDDIDIIRIELKNKKPNLHPKTFELRDNWDKILHQVDKFKGDCDTMVMQAVIEGFILGIEKGIQLKELREIA